MEERKSISLCMIVRDEASNISNCLESVRKLVDESIVVDTGSEDGTAEIAEKLGAKVFHFPWGGDFSEARNFALRKCESDYILYLDADEEMDTVSVENIQSILQNSSLKAYRCKIVSKTGTEGKITFGKYCRLFPNSGKIKFTGRVHEQIEPSLIEQNYELVDSEIVILHHGYDVDDDALKRKAERNLPLLLSEFEENPEPYYAYQLGQTYVVLDKDEEAKNYFDYVLEHDCKVPDYRFYALQHIANYYLKNRDLVSAESAILKLLREEPNRSTAYLLCSKIYAVARDWQNALLFAYTAYEKCCLDNPQNTEALVGEECDKISVIAYGIQISLHAQNRDFFDTFINLLNEYFEYDAAKIFRSLADDLTLSINEQTKICEEFPDCLKETVILLLKQYRHQDVSIKLADSLMKSNLVSVDLILLKADLLVATGAKTEAIQLLKNSYKKFPVNPGPALYLLSFLLEQGDVEGIESVLSYIEAQFANDPDVLAGLNSLIKKAG